MSLLDDKRNVFTSISSYTSYMQQNPPPNRTDIFKSINNKRDSVPFLLDILKTLAGTDGIKILMGDMLTTVINDSESKIKTVLKKQFTDLNSSDYLSNNFKINGITIPIKSIDTKSKLKINPLSDSGKLLYKTTGVDFDSNAYDAIQNNGTPVEINNLNISLKYSESTDSLIVKPIDSTNITISSYFANYIDNTTLINKSEVVTNILDKIYGTLSKKNSISKEEKFNELQIEKMLDNVLNNGDFTINQNDYSELLKQAEDLSMGAVTYDMGCGFINVQLPFESLKNTVNIVSVSNDSFFVSNVIENTINESTTGSTDTKDENFETIKDSFFSKLIKTLTNELLRAATMQPQIRMLLAIRSTFQNNGDILISNAKDDMEKFAIFIKCMAKEILKMILEYIFNLAIAYLIKLLEPVTKKVLKEKTTQYANIIQSLVTG